MAVDFPGSPTNGQVFSVGGASWRYNGYAWARIPDPGEKGQKGQKGEVGEKGQKGQTGDKGVQGNFGGATFDYTFSASTGTPTDLNTGRLRFNNSSVSSATIIFIDDEDDNGTDIQPFLRTIDDSTSTIKGHVRISNKLNADDFALFTISSASEQSGFHQINVGYVSGSASSFTNGEDIIVTFARTGDQGQKGEQGIQGVPGVQDKIFEGDTEAEVVDTGGNGHFKVTTEGTERFKIDNVGLATFTNDVVISNTLFLNKTTNQICKIDHNGADLELHADGNIRFFESDNDKLMFTFDVNTIHNDARIIMENDSDTYFNHPDNNHLGFTAGGTETIRIKAGKVGIKNNSPTTALDVTGSIRAFFDANNNILLNPDDGSIELRRSNGAFIDFATAGTEDHDCRIKQEDNGLAFTTGGQGSATEKLRIKSDGQLNLAGNMQFTAANPELEFNDGGPRFRVPAANTLIIHTGGGLGSTNDERFRIGSSGQLGLAGANYGTSGQVLTSQGASSAPIWNSLPAGVTYDLVTANGANANEEKIQLVGTNSTTDTVTLAVSTGLSIARDTTTGKITLTNTDTGSGSNTFIGLTDTPSSFVAGKTLKVNGDGDAIIFADDNNTTFALSAADGDTTTQEKIVLTGTNPTSTDNVILEVSTGLSIARTGNTITFANTAPDTNTTYLLKAQQTSGNDTNPNLLLDASGSGTDDTVQLVGSGTVSVERNNDGQITITGTDTNTNTTYQLLARRQSNGNNSGTDEDPYLFLNASSGTDDSVRLVGSGSVSVERDNDGQITISGTDTNTDTTYDLEVINHNNSTGTGSGNDVKIRLKGPTTSGNTNDDVRLIAGDNVSLAHSESDDTITISTSGTLDVTQLNLNRIRFGPGNAINDDANIEWLGGSNNGYLRISTSDDNGAEYIELGDYDNVDLGGSFTQWMKLNRTELYMARDVRLNAALEDKDGQKGSNGQVLSSTGSQVNWVDSTSVGTDNYANSLSFSSGTLTLGRTGSLSNLTASIPLSGITGDFTDLDDTPNDYNGDANKLVAVNNGNGTNGTGLTFVTASSVGTDNYANSLSFSSGTLTLGRTGSLSNLTASIPLSGITGDFTDLDDTPSNYSGHANKVLTVNSNANGVTFTTASNVGQTYTAGGDYGMTLSGTEFRLKDDRRRNSNSVDVRSGNTHDFTFYDHSHGIRWYTSGNEEMRLEDDGDLHVDGDIIAYSTTVSDIRLKKDLQIIQNPLDIINKINGYTFTYKKDDKKSAGVVAQEVEKVFPQAVSEKGLPFSSDDEENPDKYKTVEYDQIVGLLVQAVKELTDKVKKLESR